MFPSLMRQRGISLVLAIFVIILMSALLLALGRQLISSSKAVSVEVQGSRAFNAAQSGLELGLTQLFRNPGNICSSVTASFSFNDAGLLDGIQCHQRHLGNNLLTGADLQSAQHLPFGDRRHNRLVAHYFGF